VDFCGKVIGGKIPKEKSQSGYVQYISAWVATNTSDNCGGVNVIGGKSLVLSSLELEP